MSYKVTAKLVLREVVEVVVSTRFPRYATHGIGRGILAI